jgi:hypothetical protein
MYIVGINNGGAGHNCNVHSVSGSDVLPGAKLVLEHYITVMGDELHAYLVRNDMMICKVGFAAKLMWRKR